MTTPGRDPRPVLRRTSWALLAVGTPVVSGALAGCSSVGAPACFPPDYSVTPSTAGVGDTVTVEANDSDCDPRYGSNAEIQVTVTDSTGMTIVDTTAPMRDAGGFTYSFEIPQDAEPGSGTVQAYPYDVDWCDDTGQNNRVSSADSSFVRASCVIPTEMLTITS